MKQFTLEQMLVLLEKYKVSQCELEDIKINCKAVNSFLHQYNMRAIERKDFYDYVFYSPDSDFSINFSLNKEALNQPNTEEFLRTLYMQKQNNKQR